ncbi:hypothetical protein BDA96_05G050800 [Sorghum bicolor]|uniref:NB-ARC domain-containing protein n=1 Tax=Sorghum bicolor TaxID=4558 RepID=A0A921UFR5_SORBI|nr:hypothetical protein BDA96_05G050800 [Sorghum bicolor]
MQAFLQAPEVTQKKDKLVKVWAEQVRDLSYDIEDCLDEFMVHVGSHSLSKQLMKLKDRHRIAVQIRNLKLRIEEVSNRNRRYKLIKIESSNISDEMDSNMEDIRNKSASNIDEAELVGFAAPKRELIALMDVTSMDSPAKVICVVGMGGLGKTTLARKTYESKEDTLKSFPFRAWITVSQSFSKRAMLQDMINQFFRADALKKLLEQLVGKVLEDGLASYLRTQLQDKRYFIVFDDLWEINHWNWISGIALPKSNNKGSQIIITTRNVGLAGQCTSELLIYHLKALQSDDAIKLLQRKTNITHEEMDKDENLSTIVTKVVKKCGYLPLAILTIGGVLATKKIAEWVNFYNKLPSELESNPSLEALQRVVTLSYNHLPSHLKPCLLYFSIFPEDYEIKRSHLVHRWIAEGFVRAKIGTTIDEVGKEYFDELISRSMIQSSKLGIEGSVKTCRVHDIMRDIIVSISREENFVYLIQSNGNHVQEENFRHVAYHDSKCRKEAMDWRHIRSLTFFTDEDADVLDLTASICTPKLRMLRVLDLVGGNFRITQDGINKIAQLYHLKYLNVRTYDRKSIYSLPSDTGKIQGLQVLDIGPTYITTLPTEITKLEDLRVIRCNRKGSSYLDSDEPLHCLCNTLRLPIILLADSDSRARAIGEIHMGCSSGWSRTGGDGVRVPRGVGNLQELQILESVDIRRTSSKAVKELGELTRLRKLAMETNGASKKKCKILCESIEKLSSLPSQLKEDKTMEILGELPKLMLLRIHFQAYLGEKLVFTTGAFLNLRTLQIWRIEHLKEIRFEEGTSRQMERIEIMYCILKSGIIGVKHLLCLKVISLHRSKVARLGMLEAEVNEHLNCPVLRLSRERSYHDLGDVEGPNVEVEATESLHDHAGRRDLTSDHTNDD